MFKQPTIKLWFKLNSWQLSNVSSMQSPCWAPQTHSLSICPRQTSNREVLVLLPLPLSREVPMPRCEPRTPTSVPLHLVLEPRTNPYDLANWDCEHHWNISSILTLVVLEVNSDVHTFGLLASLALVKQQETHHFTSEHRQSPRRGGRTRGCFLHSPALSWEVLTILPSRKQCERNKNQIVAFLLSRRVLTMPGNTWLQ